MSDDQPAGAAAGRGVLAALRDILEARGFALGADTAGFKHDLYVMGDEPDRPRALFEVKESDAEVGHVLQQGHWPRELPPRVLVLPEAYRGSSAVEVLCSSGMRVAFYRQSREGIVFLGLDEVLALLS